MSLILLIFVDLNNMIEFKTFDKVLVRDSGNHSWLPNIFINHDKDPHTSYPYQTVNAEFKQCIPYEGNEYLAFTTRSPLSEIKKK